MSGSRPIEPDATSQPQQPSDEQLARRAQAGDAEACCMLADRYADSLFRLARSMVGNASDAEDVVQETLIGLVRGIERFEQRSSVRTWLFGILIRQASRLRKKRRPIATLSDDLPAAGAAGRTADADVRMDVMAALQTLSDEHRQVIVLREMQGLSYEEIAQVLDIPMGTVDSRLYRARRELRERLKGYER